MVTRIAGSEETVRPSLIKIASIPRSSPKVSTTCWRSVGSLEERAGEPQVEHGLGSRALEGITQASVPDQDEDRGCEHGGHHGRHQHHADHEAAGRTGTPDHATSAPLEPVTDAAHRRDRLRARRVVLDLGSQPLDGDVHEPRIAEVLVVPDTGEEHLAGEHLAGSSHELDQQTELRRGEREISPVLPCHEPGDVDLEVADAQDGLRRLGRRAA